MGTRSFFQTLLGLALPLELTNARPRWREDWAEARPGRYALVCIGVGVPLIYAAKHLPVPLDGAAFLVACTLGVLSGKFLQTWFSQLRRS